MTEANAYFTPRDHVAVRVLPDGGKEYWELIEPLIYDDGTVRVEAPAGMRYDMASIPRFAWAFVSPTDRRIIRAATIHDRLYAEKKGSRRIADSLFLWIMRADGMPWFKRMVCYLAVRFFGGWAWGWDVGKTQ